MRTLNIFIVLFLSSIISNAQLFDELKKRAKAKGKKTQTKSYDNSHYDPNKTENEAVSFKNVREFYNKDLIMRVMSENTILQTAYFDSDAMALETKIKDKVYPIYHNQKGQMLAYNKNKGTYTTMEILPQDQMSFMMVGMLPKQLKLPQEPYTEAFDALRSIGGGLNYMMVDLAFVYKPEHFIEDSYYTLSFTTCNLSQKCKRFSHNDPVYKGSYIQFDELGRLNELYVINHDANKQTKENEDQDTKLVFTYKECTVKLPNAIEEQIIPGPLGKMLKKGLQPYKNN